MNKYIKEKDGITFGDGTNEEIATRDLIMNALLKAKSSKCTIEGKVSNIDIYKELNYEQELSDEEAKKFVDDFIKKEGEFNRVRLENEAYKRRYASCLLANKEIFRVATLYDNPETLSQDNENFIKNINEMKQNLTDNYLPLFKEQLIREDIASKTNYNTLSNTPENISVQGNPKYIVSAFLDVWGSSVESGSSKYQVNKNKSEKEKLINAQDINQIISNLKEGQYTDVVISESGEVGIYRVEKSQDGFDNWDDFYNQLAPKKISFRVGNYTYGVSVGTFTGAINVDRLSYSNDCHDTQFVVNSRHNIVLEARFRLEGSTGTVAGHTIRSRQGAARFHGKLTCGINTDDSSDSSGVAHAVINCLALTPELAGQPNAPQTGKSRIDIVPARSHTFVRYANYRGGTNTGGSVSHWNQDVFWGANQTSMSRIEVIVRNNSTPPPPPPPPPRQKRPRIIRESSNARVATSSNSRAVVSDLNNPIPHNSRKWIGGTQNAPVGSQVFFKHEIVGNASNKYNSGNATITWHTNPDGLPNLTTAGYGGGFPSSFNNRLLVRQGNTTETLNNSKISNSSFNVKNGHVGQSICDKISGTLTYRTQTKVISGEVYEDNGQWVRPPLVTYELEPPQVSTTQSTPACVYIPYNYELTPCAAIRGVSECGGRTIPREPGSSTPVEPTVDNPNGNTPSRPDTQWIITTWEVDGNDEDKPTPNDKIDNNDNTPCRTYDKAFRGTGTGSIAKNCNSSERGTGKFDPGNKTKVGGDKHLVIPPNAPLGKRYCIGLSVSPYKLRENESKETQDKFVNNQWRHSAPICVMATKKPKLQIWGNGIYSNAGIRTSRSRYDGKGLFGSWVEYEAISNGRIDRFASESSREGSNLTFANRNGTDTTVRGNWGQWNGATNIDNVIANINGRYPSSRDGVNIETAGETYGGYNGNGTPNIHTHIIKREGNLFLTGDIIARNPTTGNGVNKFQQNIIIVNGDLTISQDVTQIDAWLIVTGTITTCVPKDTGRVNQNFVNNDNCGKPLRVNSPVIAGNLNPWRTGASDHENPNTPSEIFNQRPDIYLWAAHQGSARTKAITTYDKELPARY